MKLFSCRSAQPGGPGALPAAVALTVGMSAALPVVERPAALPVGRPVAALPVGMPVGMHAALPVGMPPECLRLCLWERMWHCGSALCLQE